MITLFKKGKWFFKEEDGQLIGGQLISCPTQEVADTFKEFNSEEEAREFYNIVEEENDVDDDVFAEGKK